MNENLLNKKLQIRKGELFPTNIFGNYKTKKDRKDIIKKIKEELENPKKVEINFIEKERIIAEIYNVIETPTTRGYGEEELIKKIQKLMKNGIDINHVNKKGESFLMYAIENHKIEIAKYFIENKINVNISTVPGKNALNYLVEFENSSSLTKLLIENNIDVHSEYIKYYNALGKGIRSDPIKDIIEWNYINPNAIKMIEILVENGVDMNAEIKDGKNLLMLCCKELSGNRDDLAIMLIEKGCDLNLKDSEGETALHLVMKNYTKDYDEVEKVINLMIEKNVDINIKDSHGNTLVNYALCGYNSTHNSRKFQLLKTLLQKCDLYAMNEGGYNILDYIYYERESVKQHRTNRVVEERIEEINREKSDELEKQIELNLKDCTPRKLRSIHYNAKLRKDILLIRKIEERQSKFEKMLNYLNLLEF